MYSAISIWPRKREVCLPAFCPSCKVTHGICLRPWCEDRIACTMFFALPHVELTPRYSPLLVQGIEFGRLAQLAAANVSSDQVQHMWQLSKLVDSQSPAVAAFSAGAWALNRGRRLETVVVCAHGAISDPELASFLGLGAEGGGEGGLGGGSGDVCGSQRRHRQPQHAHAGSGTPAVCLAFVPRTSAAHAGRNARAHAHSALRTLSAHTLPCTDTKFTL